MYISHMKEAPCHIASSSAYSSNTPSTTSEWPSPGAQEMALLMRVPTWLWLVRVWTRRATPQAISLRGVRWCCAWEGCRREKLPVLRDGPSWRTKLEIEVIYTFAQP